MDNRQLASSLCALVLLGNLPVSGAEPPKPKGGPIFTIPKTLVTVDIQIDKVVQTPGVYCEYLDLFFPGLDPAVPCNGNLLPPLIERTIDQLPGSVELIDATLFGMTPKER